jgi:PPM family protein phosphatase
VAVSAARSDVGRKRAINEDSYVADDRYGLFAVADGMGGHAGGEVASQITAEALLSFVSSSTADSGITWPFGFTPTDSIEGNQLRNAIQLANQLIISRAAAEPALQGLGSTCIACMITGETLVYGNVGDSRLYLLRGGVLSQVSEDDSWAASMLRAGASEEMVRRHEMRHVLTRALGSPQALAVEVREYPLRDGDILLLCSDGLYGPLGDSLMAEVLRRPNLSLEERAQALIDAANAAGGPDNITAVLVKHESEATAVMASPFVKRAEDPASKAATDALPPTDRIILGSDGQIVQVGPDGTPLSAPVALPSAGEASADEAAYGSRGEEVCQPIPDGSAAPPGQEAAVDTPPDDEDTLPDRT